MQAHALEAVSADAVGLMALVLGLLNHQKGALLTPGLLPAMAMFVIESRKALRVLEPDMAKTLEHEFVSQLAPSRRRAKLLDDRKLSVEEVARELSSIARNQTHFFLGGHSGPLSPLKRAMQPDLGLTTYDAHVISTTHFTAAIVGWNSGLDPETLGNRMSVAGYEFAVYGLQLLLNLGLGIPDPADVGVLDGAIVMRDAHAPALYRRGVLGQLPHDLAVGATGVLASINHLKYIVLPVLATGGPTAFRLKVTTAFHAATYLAYLQRRLHSENEQNEQAALLAAALGTPESRWLRNKKALRNTSVHYLATEGRSLPAGSDASREAVLVALGGRTVEEMHHLVDQHIASMSRVLEDGFDLLDGPLPGVVTSWPQRSDKGIERTARGRIK